MFELILQNLKESPGGGGSLAKCIHQPQRGPKEGMTHLHAKATSVDPHLVILDY